MHTIKLSSDFYPGKVLMCLLNRIFFQRNPWCNVFSATSTRFSKNIGNFRTHKTFAMTLVGHKMCLGDVPSNPKFSVIRLIEDAPQLQPSFRCNYL